MNVSSVYSGAPQNAESAVQQVFALLEQLKIPYTRVEHDAADTMEDCIAVGEALGAPMCKNLFLCNRQKTEFYLLAMPGDKPFKTKDLSAQIGSARLSFADGEMMQQLLNCAPGSASLMGLAFDSERRVHLLLDKDVYEAEEFVCHPCRNTGSLKIRTADLLRVFLPHTGHEPTVVTL